VSVSSTISYAESFGPEAVRPGEAALRGSSRVVPGYWGVRPVRHQPGTPIIPKSSVRRASHPKGCGDLRKAELGSRCIRTRDKDTREAVVERAVGQYAGPASNRTIRRSTASEPSGSTPGPSRPNHPPKRRERAVGQYTGPDSNRTLRRSATSEPSSEPSGNTPGPSRCEPSAEAPRASRRASRRAIRRARLESNHPPKHRERAVGQAAAPFSNRPPKRYTQAVGQPPGMRRTTYNPSSEPLPRNHQAIRRASRCRGNTDEPSRKPPGSRRASAVHQAIRRASRCRGAAYDPVLEPQPAGAADIEPNPLDYFVVNPLRMGDLGKDGREGYYSRIIIKRRRRPRAPHLLHNYRET